MTRGSNVMQVRKRRNIFSLKTLLFSQLIIFIIEEFNLTRNFRVRTVKKNFDSNNRKYKKHLRSFV